MSNAFIDGDRERDLEGVRNFLRKGERDGVRERERHDVLFFNAATCSTVGENWSVRGEEILLLSRLRSRRYVRL